VVLWKGYTTSNWVGKLLEYLGSRAAGKSCHLQRDEQRKDNKSIIQTAPDVTGCIARLVDVWPG
jgi:hypothetical protein